jgi:hypothetical protein
VSRFNAELGKEGAWKATAELRASLAPYLNALRRITESLERPAQLYDAWDKPAQAAEWKQKLAAFQQTTKAAEKKEGAAVNSSRTAFQSARGLAQSKTWRTSRRPGDSRARSAAVLCRFSPCVVSQSVFT